jgi:hypothetical protein
MRKILFVFLTFVGLLSCESDDGITYTQPDYLSGKWILKEIGAINQQNVLVYNEYVNDPFCEEKDNLILSNDFTFQQNSFESENTVCQNNQTNGTYVLENNTLILSSSVNGQTITLPLTIISLTYEIVTISFTDTETGELIFMKLEKEL